MPVIANGQPAPPPPAPGVIQQPVALPTPQSSLLAVQGILNALYAARLKIQTGLVSITIDGETTQFTRPQDLDDQILFWERKAAVLSGKRRRTQSIRMDHWA